MRTKQLLAMAAAAATALFCACSDDDGNGGVGTPMTRYGVVLDMPLDVNAPTLTRATATFTNVNTKQTYTADGFTKLGEQYTDTLDLPQGTYNVTVEGDISYTIGADAGATATTSPVKATRENLKVDGTAPSLTLGLNTWNAQEGLVITEIFFTGTLTPEGKQYSDDQYFKIGNNSDSTLYLDGLAIVESAFLTTDKQDYTPDIMAQAMTVDAVYCFPGSGKDHPIAPGQEVVVALNAVNHKEYNPQSIDLSRADFEFYDESQNPSFTDTDNPDVPNLVNWYDYSLSYFSLHNRGFKSYALARPTVDAATFMSEYKYTYTWVFSFGEYVFDMDDEGFKVPNSWIVDAVNLSVASDYQWIVTSPSLDAGWTHCGSVDQDKTRYGKAVVRKRESGKWIDTNNSTNDFEADAVPTLLR